MIRYVEGANLFGSKADALVNPVNCVGAMGKGIALEFSRIYPECVPPYKEACRAKKLRPGILLFVKLVVQPSLFTSSRPGIILFPTKDHWRDTSRVEWIEQGLNNLKDNYRTWGITSIAMPQIGCGLGGLEWSVVQQIIEKTMGQEPVTIEVYLNARSMGTPSVPGDETPPTNQATETDVSGETHADNKT